MELWAVMSVKSVIYGILARRKGLGHFTGADEIIVQITV
jgi:hypothetical protein